VAEALARLASPPVKERAALNGWTVDEWSYESWLVARDTAYAVAYAHDPCAGIPPERAKLSNEMIEALIPPLRLQIERGGLRLARLLDEALG
jgi:hypothetical protein